MQGSLEASKLKLTETEQKYLELELKRLDEELETEEGGEDLGSKRQKP